LIDRSHVENRVRPERDHGKRGGGARERGKGVLQIACLRRPFQRGGGIGKVKKFKKRDLI